MRHKRVLVLAILMELAEFAGMALGESRIEPVSLTPERIIASFKTLPGQHEIWIEIFMGEMRCQEDSRIIPEWLNKTKVIYKCPFGGASLGTIDVCKLDLEKNLKISQRFGNKAILLSYQVSLRKESAVLREDPPVTFGVGRSPFSGCAWPLWWHEGRRFEQAMDLVFVPNDDYGLEPFDNSIFAGDAGYLVERVFFSENSDRISSKIYSQERDVFNLWIAPVRAHAYECQRTLTQDWYSKLDTSFDGIFIVHQGSFRDCAEIAMGGYGTAQAGRPSGLVHESGHLLFGLADEYACGGAYECGPECSNVWDDIEKCRSAARQAGFDAHLCKEIVCSSPKLSHGWRVHGPSSSPVEKSIMANVKSSSEWLFMAESCLRRHFRQCSTSCYK